MNRRLQALRKFFDLAVAEGWADANPADEVPLLSDVSPQRIGCRRTSDIERVRTIMQDWPARDRAIIYTMLGAGLKLGELIHLKAADVYIDDETPCLSIGSQNGQIDGRIVPLDVDVCNALRAYVPYRRPAPGIDRFFVSEDGRPLSTRSVQRLLHECARAAGLDTLTAQDLRYIYARAAYTQSGDVKEVARLLGHRHLATTIRYLRPDSTEME